MGKDKDDDGLEDCYEEPNKLKRESTSYKNPCDTSSPKPCVTSSPKPCDTSAPKPCETSASKPCIPCPPQKGDPCETGKKIECGKPEKPCDDMQKRIETARDKCKLSKLSPSKEEKSKISVCETIPQSKLSEMRQKITGVKESKSSLADQLLKYLPKVEIPKLSKMPKLDKETLLCAVKCSKDWIMENCDPKKMAEKAAANPGRPMKFPYTFSAKFAQFPLKHYVNNQWIWKYYFVSVAVCLPIFYSISNLANSPGNVAKWAEIRRKEAEEHHH